MTAKRLIAATAVVTLSAIRVFAGGGVNAERFVRTDGRSFEIQLDIQPADIRQTADAVDVTVQASSNVFFHERRFKVEPNTPYTVRGNVSESGSAVEIVTFHSACCGEATTILAPSAGRALAVSHENELTDGEPLDVSVEALGRDKQHLTSPVPVRLEISATRGLLRSRPGETWKQAVAIDISAGNPIESHLEYQPDAFWGGRGTIAAQLLLKGGSVSDLSLLSYADGFTILPAWWVCFLATISGALLWSVFGVIRNHKSVPLKKRLFAPREEWLIGAASGAVGYAILIGAHFAGFGEVNRNNPWGFVVVGMLVSVGGAETILKRIIRQESGAEDTPVKDGTSADERFAAAVIDLRRRIDHHVIGEEIDDPRSLYAFVEQKIQPLYVGSYRDGLRIAIRCRRTQEDAQFCIHTEVTVMPPTIAVGIPPLAVEYTDPLLQGIHNNQQSREQVLLHATLTVGSLSWRLNGDKSGLEIVDRAKLAQYPGLPEFIEVVINDADKRIFHLRYELPLPEAIVNEKAKIRTHTVWRRPAEDDVFSFTAFRPTRGINLDASFPSTVIAQAALFGLSNSFEEEAMAVRRRPGVAHAGTPEWLLPGHGVDLAWHGLAGAPASDPVADYDDVSQC
jgi:hypothetical protein